MRFGGWLAAAVLLPVAGIAAALLFVRSGYYDISATGQHTQPVYTLLERTMHHSVRVHADDVTGAPPRDAAAIERGARCYVVHCVQCHGGPGVAQDEIGRSMQPLPGPLVDASTRWRSQELYWITAHGIKMSGMPAWSFRLADADIWALVAFMERSLPLLTATGFRALDERHRGASCRPDPAAEEAAAADGSGPAADPQRGRLALTQYACNACHRIPGVTGPDVHVGPPLEGFARRGLIAGAVVNETANLVRWIRDPRSIDPLTVMPDMDVGARDARDIAAYLQTLR